jgi:Flp pilus assembly protein TadG
MDHLARFATQSSGSAAILFAVALLPIMMSVGAAVDYSRASNTKAHLQSLLDGALLAGAKEASRGMTPADVSLYVQKVALGNTPNKLGPKASVTVNATVDLSAGAVNGTATIKIDSVFAKLMGFDNLDITTRSQALFGAGQVEIALALDTTGSMQGTKLDAAQKAANALVDQLFAGATTSSAVKVSLVPFANYVNVGLQYRNASWITGAADQTSTSDECWDEYPDAQYLDPYTVNSTCYNDGTPYSCSWTEHRTVIRGNPVRKCERQTHTSTWNGCVGSRKYPLDIGDRVASGEPVPALLDHWCSQPLVRLTNSASAIKSRINSFSADGETFVQPALLWAWRTLSPEAPFADGAPASKKISKTIVLMTDGANTKSPNYPDHEDDDTGLADNLTTKTCDNIKSAGIRVMVIAFSVDSKSAYKMLQKCASSASDYYEPNNTDALYGAFKDIGDKLTTIRLAK